MEKQSDQRQNSFPPQQQKEQPGMEFKMNPEPECMPFYKGIGKFKDQVVLISCGDSGISRAISLAFAKELLRGLLVVKNRT